MPGRRASARPERMREVTPNVGVYSPPGGESMRACQRHFFALVTGLTCVLARDARADRAVITVGDVDTLYEAVNDPGNAGAVVHVRQGLYVLDATVPPFGRLVLQPGMDLVGENQYLFVDGRPAPRDAAGETFADPPSETILD